MEESPREILLWGMLDGQENIAKFSDAPEPVRHTLQRRVPSHHHPPPFYDYHFVPLAFGKYGIDGPTLQEFEVFSEPGELGLDFGVVVLQILSNWGGPSTTICRVNVMGL